MAENGNEVVNTEEEGVNKLPQDDEIDRSEAKSDMNTLFILDLMRQKKEKLMRLKKVIPGKKKRTTNGMPVLWFCVSVKICDGEISSTVRFYKAV